MSKEGNLEGFEGWGAGDAANIDFFPNPGATIESAAAVVEKVKADTIEPPKPEAGEAEAGKEKPTPEEELSAEEKEVQSGLFKVEDEDDLGLSGTEKTTEETEAPEAGKEGATKNKAAKLSNVQTLELLKERGLVEYELEDGQEMTDELAESLIEDGYDNAIMAGVEETIKELPPVVKALVKTAASGGDINKIIATMVKTATSGITEATDMSVEDNQIAAIKFDLKEQGHDDEYIETNIQFLKDTNKLEAMGKKAQDKIVGKQKADAEAEAARAAEAERTAKASERKYKSDISAHIMAKKDINGLPITKKDAQTLPAFMTEKSVELKNGAVITPMQEAYFKAMQDPDKAVLLAKLLATDFDLSSVVQAGATQVARQTRQSVQETGNGNKGIISGSQGSSRKPSKSLADMLDD